MIGHDVVADQAQHDDHRGGDAQAEHEVVAGDDQIVEEVVLADTLYVSHDEIAARAPTSDAWIKDRLGIEERRFAADDDSRPKLTYLPFSAGAHHCIGETLAIFEMLVHLNRFARRFRLRRVDTAPVEFEALINLRATRPFIMRLEPRTGS